MRDSKPLWQKNLAQGFSTAQALLDFLHLPQDLASSFAEQAFRTRVPRGFAERMQKGDPRDPLLLQVLATPSENTVTEGYRKDALEELTGNPLPGLLHKYRSRVLFTLSGACAVNCRFCFRRHFPYADNNPGTEGWKKAVDYIASDTRISEVIFSGGDPLIVKDDILSELIKQLATLPHIKTVRFHTRIPVVLPERVTPSLLAILNESRFQKVIVVHVNHPQELNAEVQEACRQLRDAGCHLLNQSVLLRDINDNAETLAHLSQKLFEYDILPYYLHVPDKVQNTAHFDLSEDVAKHIFSDLQTLLPGYLVPRLVREIPGQPHKTLLL